MQVPEKTPTEVYQARASGEDMIILDCRNADEQDVSMIEGISTILTRTAALHAASARESLWAAAM